MADALADKSVYVLVGWKIGCKVGCEVGCFIGCFVGCAEGEEVGWVVGCIESSIVLMVEMLKMDTIKQVEKLVYW
jgi:hypothetical protein